MVLFLKSMPVPMNDKHINNFLEECPVHIDVPLVPFDWTTFINQAKLFFKVNFMPFVMFMCGAISTFHFQQIVTRIGKNVMLVFLMFTLKSGVHDHLGTVKFHLVLMHVLNEVFHGRIAP